MNRPVAADVQRWSEEVARDPASLAFLPLAQAFRRGGRRDAAIRLCLRGLERHPASVEAHALLASLYLEAGDRERARDEWSMILSLDAANFEALRGLGFSALERGDFPAARRLLAQAAAQRGDDAAVAEALGLAESMAASAATEPADAVGEPLPFLEPFGEPVPVASLAPAAEEAVRGWSPEELELESAPAEPPSPAAEDAFGAASAESASPAESPSHEHAAPGATHVTPEAPPESSPAREATPALAAPLDPADVFAPLAAEPHLRWAVLVDGGGYVLASSHGGAEADARGAWVGGVAAEAARTATHLQLGEWKALLLEVGDELIHVGAADAGARVALASSGGAPLGWLLRTAARAADLARGFAEASR